MTLRVLVVDDEVMARRRLIRLLSALPDVEIAGEAEDGTEVPSRVEQGGVDLILLDIEMAELSGIEAMQLLPEGGPKVVFVTAHAEHAVFAFDAGAVDYVLKPVAPERLKRAMDRVRERLAAYTDAPRAPAESTAGPKDKLAVPTRRGLVILDPNELRYAMVDGASVTLHSTRGVFVTDFRIVALEKRLPEAQFVRVHRRVLLNLDHVTALEPVGAGVYVAETSDGASVPVSRQAAKRLKARWTID